VLYLLICYPQYLVSYTNLPCWGVGWSGCVVRCVLSIVTNDQKNPQKNHARLSISVSTPGVLLQKRSNETCRSCGGQGFVVCQWCQGSRKSLAHDFNSGKGKHNFFLNCTVCNSNGLQPCPDC